MIRLRLWALLVGLFIVMPYGCSQLVTVNMQRRSLPQKLRTGWFYAEGSCQIFMSHQGAFAFDLRQETIDAINGQGIRFFEDIGSDENAPNRVYFSNSNWKETPVDHEAIERGATANLDCGPRHSWLWPKGVEEALKQPGSYYAHSGPRGIFVIPKLRLVVGSASDR